MTHTIHDKLIELCLIFLIIFTPLAYGAVHPWSIAVFEVTAALMFLFWVFKILKTGAFEFVRNPLTPFIFLFIFYIFLQLFFSIYFWVTKTELLKVISYALIFFVTLNTIKTRQQIIRILSVIMIMGFMTGIFYLMRYFGATAPRGFINPDHFSAYLGMIIPIALGFLFVPASRHSRKDEDPEALSLPRFLLFFCVIVMSGALFMTMSRGGIFSFIAALLLMMGLALTRRSIRGKGWIISAVLIFIILAIAWLGATPVVERILSVKAEVTSRYFGGRLPIWQGTFDIIRNYPLFGTGFGTFNYIFPKYQPIEIMDMRYIHAHSDILELFCEVGIAGFFMAVLCGSWTVIWLFKRFYSRHNTWVMGLSIGIFGSLISIFLHSFTDFNLHISANAILLTVVLSLFIAVLNNKLDSQHSVSGAVKHALVAPGMRYPLYLLTSIFTLVFIIASICPAFADYYATHSTILDLKRAVILDPTNAAYHYELGKLYAKQDKAGAISAYKRSVELNPTNSKYHQSLAWTYGNLEPGSSNEVLEPGLVIKSHEHFQAAIGLEPNNSYRHRAYAIWLFNHSTEENIKRGVVEYRKAAKLEPKITTEAIKSYYRITGNYDLLSEIIPDTAEGHFALRKYFLENDLKEKALKEENIILSKLTVEINANENDQETYKKVGRIYLDLGKPDEAIKTYHRAIELGSSDFWTYYWLAESYRKAQKIELAIEYFKISSKLDPGSSWPYLSLARIYKRLGKELESKAMYQSILNLKNPDSHAEQIAKKELERIR